MEKLKVQEVAGHEAEVKNKLYHPQISSNEVFQWLVYKVYYLLVKNSKVDRRRGLKERGVSSPEKEGDIREGANRGFTVICFSIKH